MPGNDGQRILGDFWKKKAVSWDLKLDEWVDVWASARPGQLGLRDEPRVVGSDGTVSIVEIVSFSPRVENLKVKKVIKVSYLNYQSCQCFGIPRYAGHCWRSKEKIVSDVLLWTPAYGQSKAGRPARTFIQQLCDDTGCNPEDLPEAMNDRETWRERVRDIRASRTTWWWWWWWWCIWTLSICTLYISVYFTYSYLGHILNRLHNYIKSRYLYYSL